MEEKLITVTSPLLPPLMEEKLITVTSPLLPPLDELVPMLQDIWDRKWLTNNGHYHQELERALCDYLKVPYVSLFTNGTLPLMCALQALRITGGTRCGGTASSRCSWTSTPIRATSTRTR